MNNIYFFLKKIYSPTTGKPPTKNLVQKIKYQLPLHNHKDIRLLEISKKFFYLCKTMCDKKSNRFIDITGKRIGYVTITGLSDKSYIRPLTNKQTYQWIYKFSCGCNHMGMRDTLLLRHKSLKKCTSCDKTLSIDKFHFNKKTLTGLSGYCKECKSSSDKNYRNNPAQGVESILRKKKEYYYNLKTNHPEKYLIRLDNARKRRDYSKETQRVKSCEILLSKSKIRKILHHILKNNNMSKSKLITKSEDILGCSFDLFKSHIESQFKEGMSWYNHGQWHIDHKVPLNVSITSDEVLKLNHYTNLQPLWADENLIKGGNMLPEHHELHYNLLGRNYIK